MKNAPGYDLINEVLSASLVLVKESHRVFRPHGLTDAQFNVINVLADRPEGMSQRELSDLLVVDRSNVTGLLDRMEKCGWVKRSDHPSDRRVYLVTLSSEGRHLWQKVHPDYLTAVKQVTKTLSESEMKRTLETLRRLEESTRHWGNNHEA